LTLALRKWGYVVFLWLSLGTAAVHAIVPLGSPLVPRSGSAFSAFTSDLSLGPQRGAQTEKAGRHSGQPNDGADGTQGIFASLPAATRVWSRAHPGSAQPVHIRVTWSPNDRPSSRFQARAPPRF
jgi:hypothetical protein